ncbi:Rne/Rng family ribonuclease [Compostimonas suwonensis]|uniref:Ribonuclease E n=1 Tax=Compostimonas suwonensis TaxID=1048394 RepID=A0A2M9BZD9_9MICO|nr:Rne/Rng family ribonuclease [Compostimonas suwonensis]PJJ63448.1 ribonuclease E [Compostimonas suwonensis]
MVDETENSRNDSSTGNDGVKKRGRLFGSRRSKKAVETPPVIEAQETVAPPGAPVTPPVERAHEQDAAASMPPAASTSATTQLPMFLGGADSDGFEPEPLPVPQLRPTTSLIFQAPDLPPLPPRSARDDRDDRDRDRDRDRGRDRDRDRDDDDESPTLRRRARRRPGEEDRQGRDDPANTVVKVRTPREPELITEPQRIKGSTRLEAKKQRRRDGRDAGRRRPVITEAEFLARRESVDRVMVVRSRDSRIQIGVLEDGVLVEHYVAKAQDASLIGNVYLGRVQNVLPSMEAAFVDIGRGRNAVLYSGEVDWDAVETGNQPRRIELALKAGDKVLVQVTKDPIGHKGARLTSQVSLPGRYLVYVPNGSMNGISRKLPDTERARLKKILKEVLPDNTGVIVRTAAEGATEEQLTLDVTRLTAQWADISAKVESEQAPAMLHSEPDLLIKIVRDVFNEDFQKMVIQGAEAQKTIERYLEQVAPDLLDRVQTYEGTKDAFDEYRVSEQIEKALDRKVWLPSGGSLVIDRTEAMTVVDVNTGKFVGSGGNLEETVTKNNLEAAEEIVRQLRLRDIGGIIVVDFIDMVLETNRDLVLRRLIECLSRDRTKHQVAEVTSLGLVQMTRKKLGLGLLETFSETCEVCAGRGIIIHHDPVVKHRQAPQPERRRSGKGSNGQGSNGSSNGSHNGNGNGSNGSSHNGNGEKPHAITEDVKNALAQIAASTIPHADEQAAAQASAEAPAAAASARSGSRRARSGQSRGQAQETAEQAGAPQEPAAQAVAEPRAREQAQSVGRADEAQAPAVEETPVAILDIPVKKAPRKAKQLSSKDAEQILGSVLDALPEPKQPGQGRSRNRRVSTAALSTPVAPIASSDETAKND